MIGLKNLFGGVRPHVVIASIRDIAPKRTLGVRTGILRVRFKFRNANSDFFIFLDIRSRSSAGN